MTSEGESSANDGIGSISSCAVSVVVVVGLAIAGEASSASAALASGGSVAGVGAGSSTARATCCVCDFSAVNLSTTTVFPLAHPGVEVTEGLGTSGAAMIVSTAIYMTLIEMGPCGWL